MDLKLGKLSELEKISVNRLDSRASTMISSPSRSSKRSVVKSMSCLVDGCNSDLSKCRGYYRRHRVCEQHSKVPIVIVAGEKKRFCQQCSKFHLLLEFDEVKRSCRKRLVRHNQRRRKPQPESLCFSSGSFVSNRQGTRFLQFSIPHVHATTGLRSQKWPMIIKSEAEAMTCKYSKRLHPNDQRSDPNTYNEGYKWFSRLQENDQKISNQAFPEVSICQPLHDKVVSSKDGMCSDESDGNISKSINSNCALYLLSTHPTHTSGISLSHLMQSNVMIHPVLPVGSGLQVNGVAQLLPSHGVMDELKGPVLVPDSKQTNIEHHGMFHVMPDNLLNNGSLFGLSRGQELLKCIKD